MTMPAIPGPGSYVDIERMAVRGASADRWQLARWLRKQWERALDDLDWRDQLVVFMVELRADIEGEQQSFGDALESFMSVEAIEFDDGWPEYRDGTLNRLPRRLQVELVDNALGAMQGGMLFDLAMMYSTNGAMGVEVSTWYTDGAFPPNDDVTAFRQIHVVCPSLHTPVPGLT